MSENNKKEFVIRTGNTKEFILDLLDFKEVVGELPLTDTRILHGIFQELADMFEPDDQY